MVFVVCNNVKPVYETYIAHHMHSIYRQVATDIVHWLGNRRVAWRGGKSRRETVRPRLFLRIIIQPV